mmetsp:Transcript_27374/g.49350  ORF Transcript_27374/g.49350 Transcript_27374/m.49350 type:complete len:268 (+) Transcript_27374:522-1325(+)
MHYESYYGISNDVSDRTAVPFYRGHTFCLTGSDFHLSSMHAKRYNPLTLDIILTIIHRGILQFINPPKHLIQKHSQRFNLPHKRHVQPRRYRPNPQWCIRRQVLRRHDLGRILLCDEYSADGVSFPRFGNFIIILVGDRVIIVFGGCFCEFSHDFGRSTACEDELYFHFIGRHGNGWSFVLWKLIVIHHQSPLQPPHLLLRTMHQNNIPRVHRRDKISILHEIHMCRKTNIIHQSIQWLSSTFHRDHLFGLAHDFFGQSVFHGISSD